jgi:hypothetical protein
MTTSPISAGTVAADTSRENRRIDRVVEAAAKVRAEVAELRLAAWNAGTARRSPDTAEDQAGARFDQALTDLLTAALHADEATA